MKRITLPEFIAFLNEQTEKDFKGNAVDEFLAKHRIDQEQFLPFIYFREDTYGRNLVFRSSCFELLLLTWLPRQRTPIHDHAGQRCWMMIQSGQLSFRNYEPIKGDCRDLVCHGAIETHEQGDTVYIDDGMGIHSIANGGQRPAVSVHLYAGPIPRCRIYDEAKKQFNWVELQYFTQFGWEENTSRPQLS